MCDYLGERQVDLSLTLIANKAHPKSKLGVNLQVDGLVRLTRLTQTPYKSHLQSPKSVLCDSSVLMKTDRGCPRTASVGILWEVVWQTKGVPFALTPIGQVHQSPPSGSPFQGTQDGIIPSITSQRHARRCVTLSASHTRDRSSCVFGFIRGVS